MQVFLHECACVKTQKVKRYLFFKGQFFLYLSIIYLKLLEELINLLIVNPLNITLFVYFLSVSLLPMKRAIMFYFIE